MKVMQICPYSLTLPGGVQAQVLGLARGLRRNGTAVVVVGPCDEAAPEPGVIPVGRSIPLAANGSVVPLAPDPPAMARTIAAIRSERPDVLHVHEPLTAGAPWAALLGSRVPAVGTFHASGSAPTALYRTFRPAVRALAGRLAVRTAVSDDARRVAETHLGGAYRVLPNAVDVQRYAQAPPWPRGDDGRPAIFFVGRHEERKGLGVLLDAFELLARERDAVLWVAGKGPQTEALARRGVGDVEWLGAIGEEEKARRMRAASVFCAPSLHGESFGIVLLEGLAAGVPVVASDIHGYRDVARHDREALLVPHDDPPALRGALERVLDDRALARRLVDAGEERASRFSMEALAGRYLELYEAALAHHGVPGSRATSAGRRLSRRRAPAP